MSRQADEHQLPLDGGGAREVRHGDDVDELVELLLDLLREVALRPARQGDPGDLRVRRLGDAEAPDVVAPAAEDAGDPGEHPGLVVDEQRNRMFFNGHIPLSFL